MSAKTTRQGFWPDSNLIPKGCLSNVLPPIRCSCSLFFSSYRCMSVPRRYTLWSISSRSTMWILQCWFYDGVWMFRKQSANQFSSYYLPEWRALERLYPTMHRGPGSRSWWVLRHFKSKSPQHHSIWCNMLYAIPLADETQTTKEMHMYGDAIWHAYKKQAHAC